MCKIAVKNLAWPFGVQGGLWTQLSALHMPYDPSKQSSLLFGKYLKEKGLGFVFSTIVADKNKTTINKNLSSVEAVWRGIQIIGIKNVFYWV